MKSVFMRKMRNRVVSVIAMACLAAACLAGFGAERAAASNITSDFNISEIRVDDVIDATGGPVTVTNDIPYATSFNGIDIAIYRDENGYRTDLVILSTGRSLPA